MHGQAQQSVAHVIIFKLMWNGTLAKSEIYLGKRKLMEQSFVECYTEGVVWTQSVKFET